MGIGTESQAWEWADRHIIRKPTGRQDKQMHVDKQKKTYRQTDWQIGRQIGRQTDRQTGRQKDRQTKRS